MQINQAGKYDSRTALMEAAATGLSDVCKNLLAAGADHSLQDNLRRTAADIARSAGHAECVATLEAAAAQ